MKKKIKPKEAAPLSESRSILAGYQLTQAAQRFKRNHHFVLTVTALPRVQDVRG